MFLLAEESKWFFSLHNFSCFVSLYDMNAYNGFRKVLGKEHFLDFSLERKEG